MGCKKLTYHEQEVLGQNWKFFVDGLEKNASGEKKCCNYYSFGMQMSGRNFSSPSYRYGFNGMEKDDEMSGSGNSYTTTFRGYNPRLGRWMSIDPLARKKMWLTPYNSFSNNPVINVDPLGNTDYFNNRGKLIGSDGIDNGEKLLVLKNSTASIIVKATKEVGWISMNENVYRDIIKAPSVGEAEAMQLAWKKTEDAVSPDNKTGHEEGFISGGGVITNSEAGKPVTMPIIPELPELNDALLKHVNEKGAPVDLIVHTHPATHIETEKGVLSVGPNPSSSRKSNTGKPAGDFPSAMEIENILKNAGALKPPNFAVIGAKTLLSRENIISKSSTKVTFYDSKGIKGDIPLRKLQRVAKKIEKTN